MRPTKCRLDRRAFLRHGALLAGSALVADAAPARAADGRTPIQLHPDNPHYFLWRGKPPGRPTVLVTSGEHYGAVLNLDFDYKKYLDTLHADGLNLTRTFTGAYVEPPTAFNIARNTLAPESGRFICPWARSTTPGYANGGNKFDLTRWDPAYFERLKDFVAYASDRGVVVEMNLFCPFYDEAQWKLSPQNAANNVNGVGEVDRNHVYTLDKHGGLLAVHEAMTRKIVAELKDFDNLYYEICNEPYFGGVTLEWQRRIADVIVEAEKEFPHKHLISQNIANGKAKVEKPHPAVSIFNFHYASPPDTVAMNYGLNKVIGDNETGFKGTGDAHYRREGWDFLIAGGGLYNNLDFSFTVGHEDGTFALPPKQPGGGSPALRKQLKVLKEFIESFEFIRMKPNNGVIKGGAVRAPLSPGATPQASVSVRALVEVGRQYALYVNGANQVQLVIDLPSGSYQAEWLNTKTGASERSDRFEHTGGEHALASPSYVEDIALRIRVPSDKSRPQ